MRLLKEQWPRHIVVLAGMICLVITGLYGVVYVTFFAPNKLVYQVEIGKGNELIARVEAFRVQHGHVPSAKELPIADADSMRFWYEKCSDAQYIVGFGTTLGESMTYDSASQEWTGVTQTCPR